ncbi:MAG: hypothetical protein D6729_19630 [Deltaproteobacteria bacterium]|nr:MAG: hypothetical protein D6729_19630 [Deltaproteobacteria bacterium]
MVGESKKADFFLAADDFPVEEFPILRYDGSDFLLAVTPKMDGLVRLGGETYTVAELLRAKKAAPDPHIDGAYVLALPPDARLYITFGGGVTMVLRFVPPPRKVVVPFLENVDYQFLNLFLLLLFLHVGLFITAENYPYDTDLLADDLFKQPNRFAKFILKPPEPVKNERLEKLLADLNKDPGEAAERHKGEEGKMGRRNAKEADARSAPKAIDINDKELLANTGVFKMLKEGGSAGLSTIFGKGGLGGDLKGALGGLTGSKVGDAHGFGGLGLKGTGTGGGGLSETTIGVGGIGTKGRGGGLGGYGTGVGGLGKKSDTDIQISSGTPVVMGSLDKELIRRVIRSHHAQIRYCYERELQRKPGLYGKITAKFVIAATGKVTTAKVQATTMNNRAVESCLISRIKTWQFPKPKGGGIVIVTYPFVFKQAG